MQATLLEQQGTLRQTLDRLAKDHERLNINSVNKPEKLTDAIIESLEKLELDGTGGRQTLPQFQVKGNDHKLAGLESNQTTQLDIALAGWLKGLHSETLNLNEQIQILESLQFPQMSARMDHIEEAHDSTFAWLFDDTQDRLEARGNPAILSWLRHGSQTFWVSGKAGSGKSTLLKFFHQDERTINVLKEWASGKRLVVASFFFWHAGTTMQKSQQGLLQTLLYHILRQDPALISTICLSRRTSTGCKRPWSHMEILRAFSEIQQGGIDSKFCFFVDGLDEYDGDHLDLIRFLEGLTIGDSVKLCFSSRPWNVFESYYGENAGRKLRLQDLTRDDIAKFTHDKLGKGTQLCSPGEHAFAYEDLVQEIVQMADGVFLWVFLVVRSLRRGMTNLDTPRELQARLRELPPDLEQFFQHILDASEPIYRHQASKLYLILLHTTESVITTHDISFFAEERVDFGLQDESARRYATDLTAIGERTKTRVQARCQDLLEFDCTGHPRFLHRTVKDFLEIRDIKDQLEAMAGLDFNAHRFVCNSSLVQLRSMALNPEAFYRRSQSEVDLRPIAQTENLFWKHLCRANTDEQSMTELLYSLDKTIYLLTKVRGFNARWLHLCNRELLGGGHYEGWLADKAALNGYDQFLGQKLGGVVLVISADGNILPVPPLTCALEYMRSDHKVKEVRDLLTLGANPNEITTSGSSVWHSYLSSLTRRDRSIHDKYKNYNGALIEMLLRIGADPDVSSELFDGALAANLACTPDEIDKLKKLRATLAKREQPDLLGRLPNPPIPQTPRRPLLKRRCYPEDRTEETSPYRRYSPYAKGGNLKIPQCPVMTLQVGNDRNGYPLASEVLNKSPG